MMRPAAALAIVLAAGCAAGPRVPAGWTAAESMDAPESAFVDADSGFIFVSLVTGSPVEKDGTGRLAKLSLEGKVLAADWVKGLDAPKGLRSHRGTLWVADIDHLVGVEIATAKISKRVKVDGAKFLNDVAVGADGTVYVSDMALSRIYQFKDDKVSVFAEGEDLEHPNGLLVEGGRLIVGGWGKPEADFSTKVPGRLYALDLASKKKTLITPNPTGNLDGVESDGRGGYVVTDWMAGKVLHVSATGGTRLLRQFKQGAADHAFLPAGNVLILPHMMENKVGSYDLSDALK